MSHKRSTKSSRSLSSNGSREVEFSYESPAAREVYLAGDFNDWSFNGLPMVRDEKGVWRVRVRLSSGRHEYRFIVDGEWRNDPHASGVVPNEYGSCNCLLEVVRATLVQSAPGE